MHSMATLKLCALSAISAVIVCSDLWKTDSGKNEFHFLIVRITSFGLIF